MTEKQQQHPFLRNSDAASRNDDASGYFFLAGVFVLSLFIASRGPAYFWTSVLRPCKSPVH